MKTSLCYVYSMSVTSPSIKNHVNFNKLFSTILILVLAIAVHSQNLIKLNNAGIQKGSFRNSTVDENGNIYYCTLQASDNSLNVTCMSIEFLLLWSRNYHFTNTQTIAGIIYNKGKIYISCKVDNYTLLLVLDKAGNVSLSKKIKTGDTPLALCILRNDDIIFCTTNNFSNNSIQITKISPATITEVFTKKIEFENRKKITITDLRQFGERIYFTGSAEILNISGSNMFFGALENDGTLVFIREYQLDLNHPNYENKITAFDSLTSDQFIASGYYHQLTTNGIPYRSQGLILKLNPENGNIEDQLILNREGIEDFIYFLGIKFGSNNKIKICGTQGINHNYEESGLVYGELDLDFKNYQFQFMNGNHPENALTHFIDEYHVSGKFSNEAIIADAGGMGTCETLTSCFFRSTLFAGNDNCIPVNNSYSISDLNYMIEDLVSMQHPIPVSLSTVCGISVCQSVFEVEICKQRYTYDYSMNHLIPNKISNLSPLITAMIHDRIRGQIIIDPITSGTAIIVIESQLNLFIKQVDTIKFIIRNDSLPLADLGPDQILCNGDSTLLSFGLDSTYWSDGSIGKSIIVKNSGVYYATYYNSCGSITDSIIITTAQFPQLNIGNDVLICADQPVILNSNYDNTIWNNGMTGRSIQINNPGKIIAFVSTVCGQSFDTLNAFIFSRTDITSGPDLESCDSIIQLNGAYTNPDSILFNEDVEWKQIDSFPSILFSNIHIKNPTLSNLILDKSYLLEFNVKIGNSCILKDTVKIQYMDCLKDSCAVIIRKSCLPNGMVELTALDQNNQLIQSRVRVRELFWDIQDGPAGKSYSLLNKNPITVSNHTKFKLTSIIYKWKPGYPHTIEYADICERKLSDTIQLNCIGPCADFSFIISSCGDDVDKKNNLNFPSGYCKSVCLNNCNYIVGIFGLDGNLINSSLYSIKWSSGETTAVSNQIGCFNYSLTVEVSKGDCIWYGRYRPECGVKSGIINELTYSPRSPVTEIQLQDLKILLLQKTDFKIYNSTGQIINYFQSDLHNLIPGIYFIETIQNGRRVLNKTFVGN